MTQYNKQNWSDGPAGGTPLSATRLNKMEDGIAAAAVLADVADGATATGAALRAAYVPAGGQNYIAKPLGDGRQGLLDWINDDSSGYLLHLRTGANSTAETAAIAVGTDKGSGNGILVSHKNLGSGVQVSQNPGSGIGVYLIGNGVNPAFYLDAYTNSGGMVLRAKNGQALANGVTTQGSTTFTSATAAFTSGDVGQTLTQLTSRALDDPAGSIPAGATIVSVQSATQVTMSAPAGATGSGILFRIGGRVPSTGLPLLTTYDTDGTTVLTQLRRASALINTAMTITPVAGDTTRVGLAVKASNAGTVDAVQVQETGGTAHVRVTQPTAAKAASLVVGKAALPTTATDGYIYAPTVAGTPTGTPTAQAGTVPIVVDTTGSKLWVYVGGAWKSATLA